MHAQGQPDGGAPEPAAPGTSDASAPPPAAAEPPAESDAPSASPAPAEASPTPGEAARAAGAAEPPAGAPPATVEPAAAGSEPATDAAGPAADAPEAAPLPAGARPAMGDSPAGDRPAHGSADPSVGAAAAGAPPPSSDLELSEEDALFAPDPPDRGAELAAAQTAMYQRKLADVDRRMEDVSIFWPTAVLTTGLVAAVAGVAVGAAAAISCEGRCEASPVAGVIVVGGLAVGTAGFVWLYWMRDDLRELRSERYQLERDLSYHRIDTAASFTPLTFSGQF